MGRRYSIELEPEVRAWLEALPEGDYVRVMTAADRLTDSAETLSEPYSRHLGGKVRELRFALLAGQWRITYWLAPGRRAVLLTVFRKTRMRETPEVERAYAAQKSCEAAHPSAHDVYDRPIKELP